MPARITSTPYLGQAWSFALSAFSAPAGRAASCKLNIVAALPLLNTFPPGGEAKCPPLLYTARSVSPSEKFFLYKNENAFFCEHHGQVIIRTAPAQRAGSIETQHAPDVSDGPSKPPANPHRPQWPVVVTRPFSQRLRLSIEPTRRRRCVNMTSRFDIDRKRRQRREVHMVDGRKWRFGRGFGCLQASHTSIQRDEAHGCRVQCHSGLNECSACITR